VRDDGREVCPDLELLRLPHVLHVVEVVVSFRDSGLLS
jgi:hypothetical protein